MYDLRRVRRVRRARRVRPLAELWRHLPSCGDGCRAVAPPKSCGATKSSGAPFNMLPHSRPVLAFSRDLVRARARARVSVRVRVRG